MPSFILDGATYDYLLPDPGPAEATRSWEYSEYPEILATIALAGGGAVDVYAQAARWNPSHILASWEDDDRRPHWAWVPTGSVRRVSASGWDIGNTGAARKTCGTSDGAAAAGISACLK